MMQAYTDAFRIRPATPEDFPATERLAWLAFQDRSRLPGDACDEHYFLHRLRAAPEYLPGLDFVATDEAGHLVGQITGARVTVRAGDGAEFPGVTFGPLSVLPECQNRGVGGALVRHLIAAAMQQGYSRMLIHGHVAYYPRFGFGPAADFGITSADGVARDACMALALAPGAFQGVCGRLIEPAACEPDPEGLAAFNRQNGYRARP